MNKLKKNNVLTFPANLTEGEREVEAIVFAAAEPLDVETIESKISKKINVLSVLKKIQETYSNRGINLVCITNKCVPGPILASICIKFGSDWAYVSQLFL